MIAQREILQAIHLALPSPNCASQPVYANAPRVNDVFEYLTAHGFHLMSQRSWHRGNHVLMESDMLFRRDGLEGPVDESICRVMVSG